MRTNELAIGTWLFKTAGDAEAVLASTRRWPRTQDHWLVRETVGMLRRTLARLDVSSRTMFALIEPGSCFAGTLLELALASRPRLHAAACRTTPSASRASRCRRRISAPIRW